LGSSRSGFCTLLVGGFSPFEPAFSQKSFEKIFFSSGANPTGNLAALTGR
jgi:hypothetical protein